MAVSYGQGITDELLKSVASFHELWGLMDLITFEPPRRESVPSLIGLFRHVIGAIDGYVWLPFIEFPVVVAGKDAGDRFIGGAVDPMTQTVALMRGDFTTIVVPFSFFKESGDGAQPDFSKLSFDDYGLTVKLGDYEASADGILYEHDIVYRRKLNKAHKQAEKSFGASLRRLRLQRRLSRSDFPGLSSKTIARIERNEVQKPHGKTLKSIASRLEVMPDEIESY
jgi:hypothetical protein